MSMDATETALDTQSIREFAITWFALLDAQVPVVQLLPFVSNDGLEMVFPEGTLIGVEEFIGWYAGVVRTFAAEVHVLERLTPTFSDDRVDVDVVVVWTATHLADGVRRSYRATQTWQLEAGAGLRIRSYRVLDLVSIPLAA
jgi:hypothetical protein